MRQQQDEPGRFSICSRQAAVVQEIQECHLVSGDFDYLLKTRVPDMSAYRKLLGETLLRLPGVNDTPTYVVMEEVKQSNRLVIKTR
nr:Lrp/AsnC ligand binding domain-containing protein [Klebsiella pneumoniae]